MSGSEGQLISIVGEKTLSACFSMNNVSRLIMKKKKKKKEAEPKDRSLGLLLWLKQMSHLMTKPTKWPVHPAKTQISLGICPVWSVTSLSAWMHIGSLATHWAHSEDSDQTGRMPRLIWVFAGRTFILLVLSWGGSDGEQLQTGINCVEKNWSTRLFSDLLPN